MSGTYYVEANEEAVWDVILCVTGFHRWSEWRPSPLALESGTNQYRMCLRDGCEAHDWQ